jgi:hypothetical protein
MGTSMIRKFRYEPGQVLGFTKSGKPIRAVCGGAPTDGEQTGGDGEGGNDGGGEQGGSGSLLDEEANGSDGGDGGDGGGDGGSDGGGAQGGQPDAALVQAIVGQVTQALEQRFDSIADRRVNAILKEVRKSGQQQDGGQGSGGQPEQPAPAAGPDQGVLRGARLAYREYVGGEIKFLANQERDFAAEMAARILAERVADAGPNADDDRIGREVAKEVAGHVKGLRKFYEDRTVQALKRKGLLPDDGTSQTTSSTAGKTGQPPKGATKPGDQSGFAAGAAKAQEMYGHRMPAAAQT